MFLLKIHAQGISLEGLHFVGTRPTLGIYLLGAKICTMVPKRHPAARFSGRPVLKTGPIIRQSEKAAPEASLLINYSAPALNNCYASLLLWRKLFRQVSFNGQSWNWTLYACELMCVCLCVYTIFILASGGKMP